METLAKRVREMRRICGLSQESLAQKSGLKQSDISKIENGRILRTTGIPSLARVFNCDPFWLETGGGEAALVIGSATNSTAGPKISSAAQELAALFDLLPNDPVIRATAWNEASSAIMQTLRQSSRADMSSAIKQQKKRQVR